ncbi:hypothetical protein T484DRAFT_1939739 [Baffinella frigidus]|nr:hypothetical protein T484DRAFT_1939739 [Cryptophyta sp. CCMP2293]
MQAANNEQVSAAPTECEFKRQGNAHFAAKEYVKAVAAYNKAVKANPDNAALYSNRAAAFIHLEKEVKAIKDADMAIQLKPEWAKGYFRKGAALSALRKWDEAVEVLKKAAAIEPASKEINTLLRDVMKKRKEAGGGGKSDSGKGAKGFLSGGKESGGSVAEIPAPAPAPTREVKAKQVIAATVETPIGFSESVIENFVQETLTSAITQFATQGEIKPVVYVQPSVAGEDTRLIGIEAGFDSPTANEQCKQFLRTFAADHKALAVIILAEKKSVAYPQVWKDKTKTEWPFENSEQGIFMQLDAFSIGKTGKGTERKIWFIPTGTSKNSKPREQVELDIEKFQIFPKLLRPDEE